MCKYHQEIILCPELTEYDREPFFQSPTMMPHRWIGVSYWVRTRNHSAIITVAISRDRMDKIYIHELDDDEQLAA